MTIDESQWLWVGVITLASVLGLLLTIQRLFLAPQKEWRKEVYARLAALETGKAAYLAWRDAHNETHEQTLQLLQTAVAELKGLNERVVRIETKLERGHAEVT